MSVLELEHVSKHYGSGPGGRVALRDVSLELDAGELVAVWGERRSGRSTLLRIAAGVEPADAGAVRFRGREMMDRHGEALGEGIGYCRKTFNSHAGQVILDQLFVSQLARGVPAPLATSRARRALKRTGAEGFAAHRPKELDGAEAVRVAIARALAFEPQLLVIDEPTVGIDPVARDGILELLRSLADEGIAVLASAGRTTGLSGADRALSLSDGELHGALTPKLAPLTLLRRLA